MAAVATEAGVALNTVYTSVGGKPALIEALVDDGTTDESIAPALAAVAASTGILRLLATATGEVTRRQAGLLHILLENRTADRAAARYRSRLHEVATRLAALGAVVAGEDRIEQIRWF